MSGALNLGIEFSRTCCRRNDQVIRARTQHPSSIILLWFRMKSAAYWIQLFLNNILRLVPIGIIEFRYWRPIRFWFNLISTVVYFIKSYILIVFQSQNLLFPSEFTHAHSHPHWPMIIEQTIVYFTYRCTFNSYKLIITASRMGFVTPERLISKILEVDIHFNNFQLFLHAIYPESGFSLRTWMN